METLTRSNHLPLPPSPCAPFFTATELTAAAQLVQLSGSSAGAGAGAGASSASSSPRSVNTRPPPETFFLLGAEEEEDEEGIGLWRRTKRYRPIADLYSATQPVGVRGGKVRGEKRSRA